MHRLSYICYLNATGYAQAAKNTVNALRGDSNYDLRLVPLSFDLKDVPQRDVVDYKKFISKKYDVNRVQIFHCIPDMIRRMKKTLVTVGMGVYETWEPPAHWIAILNKMDAVIVPSKFNYDEFSSAGIIKPIFHIPHCLDMAQYHVNIEPMHRWKRFTFLFLGSWRRRKGYKELLGSWVREFKNNDGVQLIIKTDKPRAAQEYVRRITSSQTAPIMVISEKYTDDQMPSFIKSADCLVSPTYGEGFGYPSLQAMALGVPVIVPNHSGCTEYANRDTAFLLEPEGKQYHKCMDGIPQFSRKYWIHLSEEQMGHVMRNVFEHEELEKQKTNAGYLYVRERFGYNAMRERFDRMMEALSPAR